jgi:PAS domain S-box-containing protein
MPSRAHVFIVEAIRRIKSHPGASIVQTRLIVSFGVLLLANLTAAFENPAQISRIILAYIILTVSLVLLWPRVLEQKRVRVIPILFDLFAISLLVAATGGLESSWFVLYLFPVLSASRYLGPSLTVAVAVLAALGYGFASFVFFGGQIPPTSFWLPAVTLAGAALTAANLARTRHRLEARLVSAIERIDREILSDTELERVMQSILNTAMDLTDSDLSAIVLVDRRRMTATYTAAKASERKGQNGGERDKAEAGGLVQQHYLRVLDSRQPLSLPEGHAFRAVLAVLSSRKRASKWPAMLVPLEISETPFGVLGVFSRRRLHYYTPTDLRKLSSMACLIAIAQKNAKLFRELASREMEMKERLQMLYEIGEQLKVEQGLDQLFQKVVTLVSTRLGSEEAALFLSDDQGTRVEKVAVSGPDAETGAKLKAIERVYEKGQSLTGGVFESKLSRLENSIPPSVEYVTDYSLQLPSGTTRHYMGVPLLIGDEVLGVIRVLNKKAENYSPRSEEASLAEGGFSEDDLGLLSMIATQVASAIRNARFIERNQYFRNLVYNSPDPIIVIDKAGKVQNFNRECEKIWGVSEHEVLGTPVENYYESAEHAREVGRALWKAKGHMIWDYRARIRTAKGDIIPIRLSATLLIDKDGQKVGSISVFKDEREILRQEEEKLRAEKLATLARLAQTTGHDIKHDIAIVLNYVDSLERGARGDPSTLEAYSAIRGAATAALSKVQNMLMTAKPRPPEKEVISLKSLLTEFEKSILHQASVTHIELSMNLPESDPFILAEREQMRQVIANLFGNSLDAIKSARVNGRRSAGRISLIADVENDILLLLWRDDGCGMSEETRTNAFIPFFTTKDTGNGLGLFIMKTIIENHGGSIAIESPDGHGVSFRIVLPIFHPSATSHASQT